MPEILPRVVSQKIYGLLQSFCLIDTNIDHEQVMQDFEKIDREKKRKVKDYLDNLRASSEYTVLNASSTIGILPFEVIIGFREDCHDREYGAVESQLEGVYSKDLTYDKNLRGFSLAKRDTDFENSIDKKVLEQIKRAGPEAVDKIKEGLENCGWTAYAILTSREEVLGMPIRFLVGMPIHKLVNMKAEFGSIAAAIGLEGVFASGHSYSGGVSRH